MGATGGGGGGGGGRGGREDDCTVAMVVIGICALCTPFSFSSISILLFF